MTTNYKNRDTQILQYSEQVIFRAVSRQKFHDCSYSLRQLTDFIRQIGWRSQLMASRLADKAERVKLPPPGRGSELAGKRGSGPEIGVKRAPV